MSTNDENSRDSQSDGQQTRMTRSRQPKDQATHDQLIQEYVSGLGGKEGDKPASTVIEPKIRAPMSSFSEAKIIVGHSFQADIPSYSASRPLAIAEADRDSCMWHPSYDQLNAQEVNDYVKVAMGQYGFTIEQALGLLHFNEYSVEKTLEQLPEYGPLGKDWSVSNKATFEQLFDFHGKNFNRIHQMMPEKPMADLIEHYYNTKKTLTRLSYIEKERVENAHSKQQTDNRRQVIGLFLERVGAKKDKENTDEDGRIDRIRQLVSSGIVCANCHRRCGNVNEATVSGAPQLLCNGCYLYYRKTSKPRPLDQADYESSDDEEVEGKTADRRDLPPNHNVNTENFSNYGASADVKGEAGEEGKPTLKGDEQAEALTLRMRATEQRMQSKKQKIEPIIKAQMDVSTAVATARPLKYCLNNTWTQADRVMVVKCFRRCGHDIRTIADVMGTKSAKQIDAFYTAYKTTYKLDQLIAEHTNDMKVAVEGVGDEFGERQREPIVDLVDEEEEMEVTHVITGAT